MLRTNKRARCSTAGLQSQYSVGETGGLQRLERSLSYTVSSKPVFTTVKAYEKQKSNAMIMTLTNKRSAVLGHPVLLALAPPSWVSRIFGCGDALSGTLYILLLQNTWNHVNYSWGMFKNSCYLLLRGRGNIFPDRTRLFCELGGFNFWDAQPCLVFRSIKGNELLWFCLPHPLPLHRMHGPEWIKTPFVN